MVQGQGELATSRRLAQAVGKKLNLPKAEGVDLISDNKSGVYLPTDQWWRAGIQTHASSFGSSKADFHAGTPCSFRCFLFRRWSSLAPSKFGNRAEHRSKRNLTGGKSKMFLFTKSLVKTALQVLLYMWVTNCDAIICLIMSQMNHEPNK